MTVSEFRETLKDGTPPRVAPALVALWRDAKGEWDQAHTIAQDVPDPVGAWVHAYLHRKEGDQSNAAYWYRRAGKPVAQDALEDEWERIVAELLAS
jgi:hypothetical protein